MSIVLIFLASAVAGFYPFFKKIKTKRTFSMPLGEAIASGVFLGAGLLHMLGESSHTFFEMKFDYPISYLLAGCIFLLLLLFEHICREMHEQTPSIAIIATVMLTIHSFLEGAALGLSQDISLVFIIFLAIIAHKWAASFALAIQINQSGISHRLGIILYTLFAIMTPLGIAVGHGIVSQLQSDPLLEPVFLSLAAGTFLYLGTLHGLKRSVLVEKCCDLKHYGFVILGFSIMAIVAIWT